MRQIAKSQEVDSRLLAWGVLVQHGDGCRDCTTTKTYKNVTEQGSPCCRHGVEPSLDLVGIGMGTAGLELLHKSITLHYRDTRDV